MKILSPVGNFESLKMAVYNGADEVYLGINNFNARNNIDGFNIETLGSAVDFAHIYNLKVNLAINILFSDEEMQYALDTIVDAYNLGVDSFIIQDLGLAHLVHTKYPEIEIHASTQMGLHNLEGVKAIEKYGFKRVVLARETPLEEIKRIKENTSLEIEYFAQGALCVSFSGNCYLSSYLCNASGNRGRCKQLCRLPYTLEKNGKTIKSGYLLSAKDFNMINKLKDLKEAGVDVLKIEGRARRPYYVAAATKEYYNALNNIKVNEDNLKLAFNREYTPGYFDGNGNIISNIQNHIGICVGSVEKVIPGKKFTEVYFTSNMPLSPKSTLKVISGNQAKSTITAYDLKAVSKNKYRLTTTQPISIKDKLHLIVDAQKEQEVLSLAKKKEIDLEIIAEVDKPIKAILKNLNNTIEICGTKLQQANKQPLSREELITNFEKSELFKANIKIRKLDAVFMQKQALNQFRRDVFENIYKTLTNGYKHNLRKTKVKSTYKPIKFTDFQVVENIDETLSASNIIYSPEEYKLKDIKAFINKCTVQGKTTYLDTPNFALKQDIKLLNKIIEETKIPIIANNYYALCFNSKLVIGAGLNVYNTFTAELYDKPIITAESDIGTKITYPYMTLRHCPLKSHTNGSCANCPYDKDYIYTMQNGKKLHLKRKKLTTCTFYLTD